MTRWWNARSLSVKGAAVMSLAAIPLVISLAVLGTLSEQDARLDAEIAAHRTSLIEESRVLELFVDAETATRGFLLTGRSEFLEPGKVARAELPRLFERLVAHQRAEGGASFAGVQRLAQKELILLGSFERGPEKVSSQDLTRAKAVMDRLRAEMAEVMRAEDAEVQEATGKV